MSLAGGGGPLESALHRRLAEHLNSEVALRTVTDLAQGVQWARSTFLHVRAARDPRRYLGLPAAATQQQVAQKIQDMCVKAMNGLARAGLVTLDEASCVEPSPAGRLMSLHCLDFDTMKLIMQISGNESMQELLTGVVCESHELAGLQLRADERRTLNCLNRNPAAGGATIRFPMKGKITTKQMKFNCMIQAIFGCLHIPDPSLHQEALKLLRTADRICKCMVAYLMRAEYVATQPACLSAVVSAVTLAKCCAAGLWEHSPHASRQLRGVGPAASAALVAAGKTTFALIEDTHPRDLERIMNRSAPAGNVLRAQVSLLPKYRVSAAAAEAAEGGEGEVVVSLQLTNAAHMAAAAEGVAAGEAGRAVRGVHGPLPAGEHHRGYLLLGDCNNRLLLCATFKDSDMMLSTEGTLKYRMRRLLASEHTLHIYCISATFVGLDLTLSTTIDGIDNAASDRNAQHSVAIDEAATTDKCIQQNVHRILPVSVSKSIKQTAVTDSYKKRKRRFVTAEDAKAITPKKIKGCAILENLKTLKESFGAETKAIKDYFQKKGSMIQKIYMEGGDGSDTIIDEIYLNDEEDNIIQQISDHLLDSEKETTEERVNKFSTYVSNQFANEVNDVKGLTENSTNYNNVNVDTLLQEIEEEMESSENVFVGRSDYSKEVLKMFSYENITELNTSDGEKENMTSISQPANNFKSYKEINLSAGNRGKHFLYYGTYVDKKSNENTSSDEDTPKIDTFNDIIKEKLHIFLQNESYQAKNDEVYMPFNLIETLQLDDNDNSKKSAHNTKSITAKPEDKHVEILSCSKDNSNWIQQIKPVATCHSFSLTRVISLNKQDTLECPYFNVFETQKLNVECSADLNLADGRKFNIEHFPINEILFFPQYSISHNKNNSNFKLNKLRMLNNLDEKKYNVNKNTSISLTTKPESLTDTIQICNLKGYFREKLHNNARLSINKSSLSITKVLCNKEPLHNVHNMFTAKSRESCAPLKKNHSQFPLSLIDILDHSVKRESKNTESNRKKPQHKVEIIENVRFAIQLNATKTEDNIDVIKTSFIDQKKETLISLPRHARLNFIDVSGSLHNEFSNLQAKCNECVQYIEKPTAFNMPVTIFNNAGCKQTVGGISKCNNSQFKYVNHDEFSFVDKFLQKEKKYEEIQCVSNEPNCPCTIMHIENKQLSNAEVFEQDNTVSTEEPNENVCEVEKSIQDKLDRSAVTLKCIPGILEKFRGSLRMATKQHKQLDTSSLKLSQLTSKNTSSHKPSQLITTNTSILKPKHEHRKKNYAFKIKDINNIDVNVAKITDIKESEVDSSNSINEEPKATLQSFSGNREDSSSMCGTLSFQAQQSKKLDLPVNSMEVNDCSDLDKKLFNAKCLIASCQHGVEETIITPPPHFRDREHSQESNEKTNVYNMITQNKNSPYQYSDNIPNRILPNVDVLKQNTSFSNEFELAISRNRFNSIFRASDLNKFRFTGKEKFKPSKTNKNY